MWQINKRLPIALGNRYDCKKPFITFYNTPRMRTKRAQNTFFELLKNSETLDLSLFSAALLVLHTRTARSSKTLFY